MNYMSPPYQRKRRHESLLCEGFLLAVCGGVIGLVLSAWCNDALLQQLRGLLSSINFSLVVKLRPDVTVPIESRRRAAPAHLMSLAGPSAPNSAANGSRESVFCGRSSAP